MEQKSLEEKIGSRTIKLTTGSQTYIFTYMPGNEFEVMNVGIDYFINKELDFGEMQLKALSYTLFNHKFKK